MKIEIASRKLSSLAVLAGLALSPVIAPAAASTHQNPFGGTQLGADSVWSDCAGEIREIGRTAANEIRAASEAGVAEITKLQAAGADLDEISRVGFRTMQFVVLRAGDARTEVQAHMRECLDFLEQFGAPMDLRQRVAAAARTALREIDSALDDSVDAIHAAVAESVKNP